MAHPYKRMRLMEDVEVDQPTMESVVQEQMQSSHMQRIIAEIEKKYGAIPEAMTDEVDMRTGEVIVDRGHMRKWNREYLKKQGRRIDLVDDLFLKSTADLNEEEMDVQEDDERDELAPSESPEPRMRKEETEGIPEAAQEPANAPLALPLPAAHAIPLLSTPAGIIGTPGTQALVPSRSAPPAHLMQSVQTPETLTGPPAQGDAIQQLQDPALFLQKLRQIRELVAPMVKLLDALEEAQVANPNPVLPLPAATQHQNAVLATPALPQAASPNPILYKQVATDIPHSSPVGPASPPRASPNPIMPILAAIENPSSPHTTLLPSQDASPDPILYVQATTEIPVSPPAAFAPQSTSVYETSDHLPFIPSSPVSVETMRQRRQRFVAKGVYVPVPHNRRDISPPLYGEPPKVDQQPQTISDEDQEDQPVDDLQAEPTAGTFSHPSKKKGGLVPEYATAVDVDAETPMATKRKHRRKEVNGNSVTAHDSRALTTSLPPPSPHLPTPSSLEHNEPKLSADQPEEAPTDHIEDLIASGGHFDDEERELLSLHGDDDEEERIWPSIETEPQVDSGPTSNRSVDMLTKEKSPSQVKKQSPPVRRLPAVPSSAVRRPIKPLAVEADSDSDDELDLSAYLPSTPHLPIRGLSKTPKRGRPQKQAVSGSRALQSTPKPSLVDDDDSEDGGILCPKTTEIKRESLTPKRLFTPALQTPQSAPQPMTLIFSGAKPKIAPMPRSAYLQKVKQAWAKGRNKPTFSPRALAKAKSLRASGQKRAREAEVEYNSDSADELGF